MEEEQWLKLHPNAKIALVVKPTIGFLFFAVFMMIYPLGLVLSGDISLTMFLLALALLMAMIIPIILIWAIMFYNRYLFRIGEDAVHINRGILWKRNVMIPYERIQHTSVTRGPIDILLGLHILNIYTAGTSSVGARFGGASSAFAAEGSIPGLSDPKPFQDDIMSRVRTLRGDGLGAVLPRARRPTPQATAQPGAPASPDRQDEMLTELRRIRDILEKQG